MLELAVTSGQACVPSVKSESPQRPYFLERPLREVASGKRFLERDVPDPTRYPGSPELIPHLIFVKRLCSRK